MQSGFRVSCMQSGFRGLEVMGDVVKFCFLVCWQTCLTYSLLTADSSTRTGFRVEGPGFD